MAYTFDGVGKTITLTAQTAMSVRDVYARWVDWLTLSDNAKFLPAFSTVGGDVIDPASGTAVPIYAFLQNGWRIRPEESSHTLAVSGGILLVAGGGDPFLNPTGSFTVRINYQQPVQAIVVAAASSAPSAAANAQAVWQQVTEGGMPAEQVLRVVLAALTGKTTGVGTLTETYLAANGVTPRITAGFDAAGNRLSVVVNGA